MQVPIFAELPPPPSDKTGWPWTEGSPKLTDHMPNGNRWPLVSIVTPSYNQGQFIEETIRSVLLQGYPNLEYIIIDGGSTDNSVEIIRKYEPWLHYWISEPDNGQSEAINKGFQLSNGEVIAWINSDDFYMPGVIHEVICSLIINCNQGLIYGDVDIINENGKHHGKFTGCQTNAKKLLLERNSIPQPAAFIRQSDMNKTGGLDKNLDYVMDYDLWIRLALVSPLCYIPSNLAVFRLHENSKSTSQSIPMLIELEILLNSRKYAKEILSESEITEVFRRLEIRKSLEYFLLDNKEYFLISLNKSLYEKGWPFGSVNLLTEIIYSYSGICGYKMDQSLIWKYLELIKTDKHNRKKQHLYKKLLVKYHTSELWHNRHNKTKSEIRNHLLQAISNDYTLLRNRGILSIAIRSI